MTKKNSAPAVVGQSAQTQVVQPAQSIPQPYQQSQGPGPARKGFDKEKCHVLNIHNATYSMAVKCYEEQLVYGLQGLIDLIHQLDPKEFQVLMIRHYKDLVTDGAWAASYLKAHVHIIIRCVDKKKRFKVGAMLNKLGVYFRPGIDDELWKARGVETVGNFTGYAVYLTHETEDAIREAKELYDVSEIVSNLTPEEVNAVREGYIRVSEIGRKLTTADLAAMDKEAYDLGKKLGNFSEWYGSQPFTVRSHAKIKVIRESYERGVDDRISEGTELIRLSIFIQGPHGCGKTTAAENALKDKRVLKVNGGGSGKFDRLRPDHGAIIIDDDTCKNLFAMSDNYICRAYRRGSNNPAWAGKYFVVTSNLSFPEWVELSGIKAYRDNPPAGEVVYTPECKALMSRFYICTIRDPNTSEARIVALTESKRGGLEAIAERQKMFADFATRFNQSLASYDAAVNKAGPIPYDPAYIHTSIGDAAMQFVEATNKAVMERGQNPEDC